MVILSPSSVQSASLEKVKLEGEHTQDFVVHRQFFIYFPPKKKDTKELFSLTSMILGCLLLSPPFFPSVGKNQQHHIGNKRVVKERFRPGEKQIFVSQSVDVRLDSPMKIDKPMYDFLTCGNFKTRISVFTLSQIGLCFFSG